MMFANWGFILFWSWVGFCLYMLSMVAGNPNPIAGYLVVTVILVVPLTIWEYFSDKRWKRERGW